MSADTNSWNLFYLKLGKRWLDILGALAGLVVLSPLLAAVTIVVCLTSEGNPWFIQVRTGLRGRPFRMWKFRTMVSSQEGNAPQLTASGDARITRVGRWLRKTKIDELPQLMNVLCGDMSLVGPRPEVPQYTALYSGRQRDVLLVKPGVTGPTAVAFVDEEDLLASRQDKEGYYISTLMPAKLALDLGYVRDIGFWNDAKFILLSILRMFVRPPSVSQPRPGAVEDP